MKCSACRSNIKNKTGSDIYVILEGKSKNDIKAIGYLATQSNITKYNLDTLKNFATFLVPNNGQLTTYSGPGLEPACNLKYLKIVTLDNIIEMKSTNDIEDAFEKNGAIFTMTIE